MPADNETTMPNGQPPRTAASSNSPQPPSFEAGLVQLTELVGRLEAGGLGLSESIDAYERGVAILRQLHDELAHAEARVRVLTGTDEDGRPTTAPLQPPAADGTAAAEGSKAGKNQSARGKSTRAKTLPGMDYSPESV